MSRKSFINIACCLLCLLPTLSFAQSLQRIEYWFDDDFSSRSTISLSGSEDAVTKLLSTDGLDNGVHKFSFRIRRSDGKYSAISSSLFFKQNDSMGEKLEYWLDDDYEHRVSMDISATEAEQELTFDLHDMEWCPVGFHQLHIRVSAEGKGMSSVYTTGIWKCPLGNATQIEYWFDNNKANSQVLSGHLSSDGKGYIINTDLDVSQLSIGMHRLNYRACDKENQFYGAVQSDIFLKVPSGNASILEYWLDDNLSTRKQFSGSTTTGGYMFTKDLDLGNVSPGHHRLSIRAKSSDGKLVTAVTSMPIIVKSRYNIDMADAEALTVTEHSYWFDNEEPDVASVSNPRNIITQPYTLDTRKLSDGQHTLHVQYGNSAGIWNGPVDITFTKTHVNDPMIAANVTVEDGVVTLKYTAIPFGQRYIVVRQYPSGTKRKVDDLKSTEYPAALQATDTPAPGTYTYYIEGIYTDADGVTQKVRSGDMAVTVEQAASTVGKGNIYGVLLRDGKRHANSCDSKVFANGNSVNTSTGGLFTINNVPYGTELTISVEDNNWQYDDVTLVVNESICSKTLQLDGSKKENEFEQRANDSYDIYLNSEVKITQVAWEMEVKNISGKTWSGNIIVKVISKEVMDMYEREAQGGNSLWYYLIHPSAGLDDGPNYKTAADAHISLGKGAYQTLALDILDLPDKKREEAYYVYVFSKEDGAEEMKLLSTPDIHSYTLPQTLNFNPFEKITKMENGFASYMEGYTEVMKYMKKFSEWGDPFTLAWNTAGDGVDKLIENLGNEEWTYSELNEQIADAAIKSWGLLRNCIYSMHAEMVKKISDAVKNNQAYIVHKEIADLYNTIKDVYNASSADDNEKFFKLASLIWKYASKKDPILRVYKSYFEVGEAMAKAAERLGNYNSNRFVWQRFVSKDAIFKIKVRKYSSDGSFAGYFSAKDVYSQIESIGLIMSTPDQSGMVLRNDNPGVSLDEEWNAITIKNVDFKGNNTLYDSTEAWMIINWKNKRVTRVPLLDNNFVRMENFKASSNEPLIMTVEFQSGTIMKVDLIADQLTFVKP